MKANQTFLKLAITFIAITAAVLLVVCLKDWLAGHFQWTFALTFLVELSLLHTLVKAYRHFK